MSARRSAGLVALALALAPARGAAQAPLFSADTVVAVTLRTDLRGLLRDRDITKIAWRNATLAYAGSEGPVTVPLKVRSRGIFRLGYCDFPPVRLSFDSSARGTLLHGLRRPKLVVHCRDRDDYEQLVLQEYAIYRVLRLLTPVSLTARLLRVTYEDENGKMRPLTRYAFVTEDPDRLARRLKGTFVLQGGQRMRALTPYDAAVLGVFQYFIGNTDWSMPGLHNISVLQVAGTLRVLPFDFDWSGVVEAPYARPQSVLPIRSVRERIWRGRCLDAAQLEPVLARFEALRDTITALYRSIPGFEPRTLERTERYYDEFYAAIADRERFVRRVVERDCFP